MIRLSSYAAEVEKDATRSFAMKLSLTDADLFFELMWGLQHYVNQQLNLVPSVESVEAYKLLPLEEKIKVRQALYQTPAMIDSFIADNPLGLSQEKLSLVSAWKRFIEGDFYIERTLKRYAVFIDAEKDIVYGVLGLYEGLDEMIHKSRLPCLVKTVLLPFKGHIVYDGLLQGSNILFGSGIKGDLKQVYLIAKEAGHIIENLDEKPLAPATAAKAKIAKETSEEFGALLNDLASQAKSLRGGKGQPIFNGPIFSLIKASLELGQAAVETPEDKQQLMKALSKTERAFRKAEESVYRYL